jgi:hypothetical protein
MDHTGAMDEFGGLRAWFGRLRAARLEKIRAVHDPDGRFHSWMGRA